MADPFRRPGGRGGIVLRDLQAYPEALADYDAAIQAKPNYAEAYLADRGRLLLKLNRMAEAKADFEKALKFSRYPDLQQEASEMLGQLTVRLCGRGSAAEKPSRRQIIGLRLATVTAETPHMMGARLEAQSIRAVDVESKSTWRAKPDTSSDTRNGRRSWSSNTGHRRSTRMSERPFFSHPRSVILVLQSREVCR